MSECQSMSLRQKVEQALDDARSLKEDLLKEADQVDQFVRVAEIAQFAGTLTSVIGTGMVLVDPGGALLSVCLWASRFAMAGSVVSTAASLSEPLQGIYTKYNLDPRWEKLQVGFDNPKEMRDVDFGISQELLSVLKVILQVLAKKFVEELPSILKRLGIWKSITSDVAKSSSRNPNTYDRLKNFFKSALASLRWVNVCKELYYETSSETAVLLRRCAEILDTLIQTYKQMSGVR